ncbi:MAG: hypothetical protein OSA93_11330 [Akkermansiaceae bacterium]|jgi:arylsulfatase A-like enzyme|nr:hypothetical protein [Akkermansiaceae bacterium]
MVEAMDESLGRVLCKPEAIELAEDTLVIFFSDNREKAAENFGNSKRVSAAYK